MTQEIFGCPPKKQANSNSHSYAPIFRAVQEFYSPCNVACLWLETPITPNLVDELYCKRYELFPHTRAKGTDTILLLDSPGGDIHAAYLLSKIFRHNTNRLTVVVPRYAKSAATLLCLAADEIVMTDIAELGPLDPLVRRPGETAYKAILDEYRASDAILKDTVSALDMLMPMLMERTGGMDIRDLLGPALSFVSQLMAPVYSQINPLEYGFRMRAITISKIYAERVLSWHDHPDPSNTAYQVAQAYPSHGFVLDAEELEKLGLPVRLATDDETRILDPLVPLSQKITVIGNIDVCFPKPEEEKEQVAPATNNVPRENNSVGVDKKDDPEGHLAGASG